MEPPFGLLQLKLPFVQNEFPLLAENPPLIDISYVRLNLILWIDHDILACIYYHDYLK